MSYLNLGHLRRTLKMPTTIWPIKSTTKSQLFSQLRPAVGFQTELRTRLCLGIVAPAILIGCSVRVGSPERAPANQSDFNSAYTPTYSKELRQMEWPSDAGFSPNEQLVYRDPIDVTNLEQLRLALALPSSSKRIVVLNEIIVDQVLPVLGKNVALVADDARARLIFTGLGRLNVQDDRFASVRPQNLNVCQAYPGLGHSVSLRIRVPMESPFISIATAATHIAILNGTASSSFRFDYQGNGGFLVLGGGKQNFEIDPRSNLDQVRMAVINAKVSMRDLYPRPSHVLLIASNELSRDRNLTSQICADFSSLDYFLGGAMTSDMDENARRCAGSNWQTVISNWQKCSGGDL